MELSRIKEVASALAESTGCFLVDAYIAAGDEVTIVIEKRDASCVCLEDCEKINRGFEEAFDREVEDYSLTVTSAGCDYPLKMAEQKVRYLGRKVEAFLKGGRRFVAVLDTFDEESVTLSFAAIEKEGKKKVKVQKTEKIALCEVNKLLPYIEFE